MLRSARSVFERCGLIFAAMALACPACAASSRPDRSLGTRQLAEAWAAAAANGDADAMIALAAPRSFRISGRLVSTSDARLTLDSDAGRQALRRTLTAFRVMDGDVRVVEVTGDDAVLATRLDLYELYDKADPSHARFRYSVDTRIRIHTTLVEGGRLVDRIEDELPGGSPPAVSFALVLCLRSDACVYREEGRQVTGRRRVEATVVTHRPSGKDVLRIRHTYDLVPEPFGEIVSEVSTELLDARSAPIVKAEFLD